MKKEMTVTEIIQDQLAKLERGIVATPKTSEDLIAFAKANQGSMDMILMQMAMQYGMKRALEFLAEELAVEVGK